MKQTAVQVKFDSGRYAALVRYAGKKEISIEKELAETLERLYKRLVPADVREYIEETDLESKEKNGTKLPRPLFLKNDSGLYRLDFDCARCGMSVVRLRNARNQNLE